MKDDTPPGVSPQRDQLVWDIFPWASFGLPNVQCPMSNVRLPPLVDAKCEMFGRRNGRKMTAGAVQTKTHPEGYCVIGVNLLCSRQEVFGILYSYRPRR